MCCGAKGGDCHSRILQTKVPKVNSKKFLSNGSRMKTSPIPVQRTMRPSGHRVLTSFEPGKMVPVLAIPLLREDSVAGAQFNVVFEMKETVEVLMNAVNARVLTYLVPRTAFERFDGLDSINKSYSGEPPMAGQPVVPWFETTVVQPGGFVPGSILHKMGKHGRPGTQINTDYMEAYNIIWNFRAKNRSQDITLRSRLDQSLAPAFWQHQTFAHVVPDFDQAAMDGAVPLSVTNARMPVRGIGIFDSASRIAVTTSVKESDGTAKTYPANKHWLVDPVATAGRTKIMVRENPAVAGFPDIFAELEDNGITLSLANIELAKKTQAFAELRKEYSGHSDDYIIDLLMQGISVPEQAWNQPILLGDVATVFGMSKRYATDADNLTESVVNGMTALDVRFRCPPVPMGGVIMMVVEVAPEQLFERQKDPYMHSLTVEALPNFLRDTLDPEKVVIVKNEDVDLDHDTPSSTFGYAPLNHEWARSVPAIGGKFYRPAVDAPFDEDRQRIWAVETQNPVLSQDFYLCTTMHQKPFVQTTGDNFEVLIRGEAAIRGLTVFGGMLIEASGDYDKVLEKAPLEKIDKDAAP